MQSAQSAKLNRALQWCTTAVTGRIDQDDAVGIAEVVGLRGPHIAGHQQAGPEQHGGPVFRAVDLDAHPAERGVDQRGVHPCHASPGRA
jgi:hypothetical protein